MMAVAPWGPQCAGSRLCCWCGNATVVEAVNKELVRDPSLMRLLRTLALLCAILNISAFMHHLTGVHKGAAGVLYHDNLALYFRLNPQTSPVASIIPKELEERIAVKLFAAKVCSH